MDNYVGKRLDGRYEVQEIVGVGGMSVVYKAYDNVDDRIVAVKILKEEFAANEEFKRRFKNESKAIALLSHPNIVKVYDVNFGERLQYIVMEYIDGITLKEYINKQGAITWNDALYFMTQILGAVQHAHDKGIVHRDIKPQNIILLSNGNIKVTDFGIARFSRSETRTLTEQAIGSVHYIAPEQAQGEYTDEKADIYSLGVVLYEMLSGGVPFEADSAVSVALMQLQADAKRLTDINPDIPLGLEQICVRAMQKNPLDRYQTATEMLLDIEEIIRNPATTFHYAAKVDTNPTKIVPVEHKKAEPVADENGDDKQEEYEDPNRKKKIVTAVIIGLIVLIAAAVLLVLGVTNGFNTKTYKLENFVGMNYDELKTANDNGAYKYELIPEFEKTDEALPGTVLSQSPEAGTKVLEGTQVTLVVATSQDDISVPNVYQYTEEQAKTKLQQAGLVNFKTVAMSSEEIAEGKVIYTDPKAGSVTSADKEITLYISSGPSTTVVQTLTIPDVYGLKQEDAKLFMEKLGFTNVTFVTQDSPIAKGVVISQSPSAGGSAQASDAIKLIISSGTTTTTTVKQVQIAVTVHLPKKVDQDGNYLTDTMIIKIDGDTHTSKIVTLDGSDVSVTVSGEGGKSFSIGAALAGTEAAETKSTNGETDESISFDFSAFSSDEQTTVPEPATDTTE